MILPSGAAVRVVIGVAMTLAVAVGTAWAVNEWNAKTIEIERLTGEVKDRSTERDAARAETDRLAGEMAQARETIKQRDAYQQANAQLLEQAKAKAKSATAALEKIKNEDKTVRDWGAQPLPERLRRTPGAQGGDSD